VAPLAWASAGTVPVAVQRNSWDDASATFVGLKGGMAASNHGHMDAGSFVLDAGGVRWALDLGAENYNHIESLGMNLWNSAQNSDRWKIFRLNNFSHNTLTFDYALHAVRGFAKCELTKNFSPSDTAADGVLSEVALDLTPVFKGFARQVTRSGELFKNGKFRLTDKIFDVKSIVKIRWAMASKAEIILESDTVVLLKQNKRELRISLVKSVTHENKKPRFKTWNAAPETPNKWDTPNVGVTMLGFETGAPSEGDAEFVVEFALVK